MDCTDLYSTTSLTIENSTPSKQKILLGFVPKNSWETCPLCCPLSSLKLTQKFSLNLLLLSCTLPNALFYKSENDIFPPKCLFTFPNPKSKGQDQIFPFSRSRVMIHSLQNESLKNIKVISLYHISAV